MLLISFSHKRCSRIKDMTNHMLVTEFFLMEFSGSKELQTFHDFLFILICLVTLMGNFLIVTLIILSQYFHKLLYFFLNNLYFFDVCPISITVSNFILNSWTHRSIIYFSGCVSQVLLVTHFSESEMFTIIVKSYDFYVAICSITSLWAEEPVCRWHLTPVSNPLEGYTLLAHSISLWL